MPVTMLIALVLVGLVFLIVGLAACARPGADYISTQAVLYSIFPQAQSTLVEPVVEFTDDEGRLVRKSCQPVREGTIAARPGDAVRIRYLKKKSLGLTQWIVVLDAQGQAREGSGKRVRFLALGFALVGLLLLIAAGCMFVAGL